MAMTFNRSEDRVNRVFSAQSPNFPISSFLRELGEYTRNTRNTRESLNRGPECGDTGPRAHGSARD